MGPAGAPRALRPAICAVGNRFPRFIARVCSGASRSQDHGANEAGAIRFWMSHIGEALADWPLASPNDLSCLEEALALVGLVLEPHISLIVAHLTSVPRPELQRYEKVVFVLAKLAVLAPYTAARVRRWIGTCKHTLLDSLTSYQGGAGGDSAQTRCLIAMKAAMALVCRGGIATHLAHRWNWTPLLPLMSTKDREVRYHARVLASLVFKTDISACDDADGKVLPPRIPRAAKRSRQERAVVTEDSSSTPPHSLEIAAKQSISNNLARALRWGDSSRCTGANLPAAANLPVSAADGRPPDESMVADIEGVYVSRVGAPAFDLHADNTRITPAVSRALRGLALSVCLGRPALLEGPPGSGKTTVLRALARRSGRREDALRNAEKITFIHLDDQIDSRSLIGNYTCTDTPGEFQWRPGALTRAVSEGRWVVLEDIDRAPPEVLSALAPLLSTGTLHIAGRAVSIRASKGFHLFATRSVDGPRMARHGGGAGDADEEFKNDLDVAPAPLSGLSPQTASVLSALFTRVCLPPLELRDMASILAEKHPHVAAAGIIPAILTSFSVFNGAASRAAKKPSDEDTETADEKQLPSESAEGDETANTETDKSEIDKHLESETAKNETVEADSDLPRLPPGAIRPTARHLFKWAERIAFRMRTSKMLTVTPSGDPPGIPADFPHPLREAAVLDACDVLLGSIPPGHAVLGARLSGAMITRLYAQKVAAPWGVSPARVAYLLDTRKAPVETSPDSVIVGRASISRERSKRTERKSGSFSLTNHSVRLMEALTACVAAREPALLVGETGNGKTAVIQHLADMCGRTLVVQNLNQQSDASDFLGGFRPVELRAACAPVINAFGNVFPRTFSRSKNRQFLSKVREAFEGKRWAALVAMLKQTARSAQAKLAPPPARAAKKRKKRRQDAADSGGRNGSSDPASLAREWASFSRSLRSFERQIRNVETGFAFWFAEGTLVKALRQGHWILLDEINLAAAETLERLSGLLDSADSSLSLVERGDLDAIPRHPNFRVFAAMNPATDHGKRDLPPSVRARFTELYVPDVTRRADLELIVRERLARFSTEPPVHAMVDMYLKLRERAKSDLVDGSGERPHYSLRTLCRALAYCGITVKQFGFKRALYEGVCMAFLTPLADECRGPVQAEIASVLLGRSASTIANAATKAVPRGSVVVGGGYIIRQGTLAASRDEKYLVTPTVARRLRELARVCMAGRYNILLQGPTSAGKTSLVEYLAKLTGNTFVRINNHEHTDLQEYMGSYVADATGRLAFQEGALVSAVRNGHWLVLDELNLAPSEVLEALNRLLDDNRELLIPETGEVVRPHARFQLFATQNPPGVYGGRKILSRAFRNRFVEVHVQEIPDHELKTILTHRCRVAPSHAQVMVDIMRDLQRTRAGTGAAGGVFAGKHSLITPRDLFRWGGRGATSYQELAENGFMLLGERHRTQEARELVRKVLESHCQKKRKSVLVDTDKMYGQAAVDALIAKLRGGAQDSKSETDEKTVSSEAEPVPRISWTPAVRRMFVLVEACVRHKEPVLLVGPTGCGKTTVCQLISGLLKQKLRIINCHQNTETADFLGGLRPVRGHERTRASLMSLATALRDTLTTDLVVGGSGEAAGVLPKLGTESQALVDLMENPAAADERNLPVVVAQLNRAAKEVLIEIKSIETNEGDSGVRSDETVSRTRECARRIRSIRAEARDTWRRHRALFLWHDGAVVSAMRQGDFILIDEISLADDAVLERLNSVLEPSRTLLLAEKGGTEAESITAADPFRVLATMNPGGDFGKKELSPALRNRFTEVWVPALTARQDLLKIVGERCAQEAGVRALAPAMLDFVDFFNFSAYARAGGGASLRDVLSWVDFVNTAVDGKALAAREACEHGCAMVLLDGLGIGTDRSLEEADAFRLQCNDKLRELLDKYCGAPGGGPEAKVAAKQHDSDTHFGVHPFFIERGGETASDAYRLDAPTTKGNLVRVLRALQLSKAVLLEGSPGVGKTSLIEALARASGHKLVRINLSEQSDMMDLLGTDLPKPGGRAGEFQWCDGVFLSAIKNGYWVLLDELNLAPQSVLEGLNSVLDHRATVYIPELDQTFDCPKGFRVFAAQNPRREGGGRRALPLSFLSRFTKVHLRSLSHEDLLFISSRCYPTISKRDLETMIKFNAVIAREADLGSLGRGAGGVPWEFNLRDIFRWCDLMAEANNRSLAAAAPPGGNDVAGDSKSIVARAAQTSATPDDFVDLLYVQRMRTVEDREAVWRHWETARGTSVPQMTVSPERLELRLTSRSVQIGTTFLPRCSSGPALDADGTGLRTLPLRALLAPLQHTMQCVSMGWPVLLVGASGSGKAGLLRLLAESTRTKLHQLTMTSATDSSEVLGCFEQVDLARRAAKLLQDTDTYASARCRQLISSGAIAEARGLHDMAHAVRRSAAERGLQECVGRGETGGDGQTQGETKQNESAKTTATGLDPNTHRLLIALLEQCPEDERTRALKCEALTVRDISQDPKRAIGTFDWVDGALLEAMVRGEWVVLHNANLCPPTVLDRLNPVLEQNGKLLVNECGLVEGKPRVVVPHPNFRLFLTMEPANGEVSRAMRNRCVEIAMCPAPMPNLQPRRFRHAGLGGFVPFLDLCDLANAHGVETWSARAFMARAHLALATRVAMATKGECLLLTPPSVRNIVFWAQLASRALHSGNDARRAGGFVEAAVRATHARAYAGYPRKLLQDCLGDWGTGQEMAVTLDAKTSQHIETVSSPVSSTVSCLVNRFGASQGLAAPELPTDMSLSAYLVAAAAAPDTRVAETKQHGTSLLFRAPSAPILDANSFVKAFISKNPVVTVAMPTGGLNDRSKRLLALLSRALLTAIAATPPGQRREREHQFSILARRVSGAEKPDDNGASNAHPVTRCVRRAMRLLKEAFAAGEGLAGGRGPNASAPEIPLLLRARVRAEELALDTAGFNPGLVRLLGAWTPRVTDDTTPRGSKRTRQNAVREIKQMNISGGSVTPARGQVEAAFGWRSAAVRLWLEVRWIALCEAEAETAAVSSIRGNKRGSPLDESKKIFLRQLAPERATHPFLAHVYGAMDAAQALATAVAVWLTTQPPQFHSEAKTRQLEAQRGVQLLLDSWELTRTRSRMWQRLYSGSREGSRLVIGPILVAFEAIEEAWQQLHKVLSTIEASATPAPLRDAGLRLGLAIDRCRRAWGSGSTTQVSATGDIMWRTFGAPGVLRDMGARAQWNRLCDVEMRAKNAGDALDGSAPPMLLSLGSAWKQSLADAACALEAHDQTSRIITEIKKSANAADGDAISLADRTVVSLEARLDAEIQRAKTAHTARYFEVSAAAEDDESDDEDQEAVGYVDPNDTIRVNVSQRGAVPPARRALLARHSLSTLFQIETVRVERRLLDKLAKIEARLLTGSGETVEAAKAELREAVPEMHTVSVCLRDKTSRNPTSLAPLQSLSFLALAPNVSADQLIRSVPPLMARLWASHAMGATSEPVGYCVAGHLMATARAVAAGAVSPLHTRELHVERARILARGAPVPPVASVEAMRGAKAALVSSLWCAVGDDEAARRCLADILLGTQNAREAVRVVTEALRRCGDEDMISMAADLVEPALMAACNDGKSAGRSADRSAAAGLARVWAAAGLLRLRLLLPRLPMDPSEKHRVRLEDLESALSDARAAETAEIAAAELCGSEYFSAEKDAEKETRGESVSIEGPNTSRVGEWRQRMDSLRSKSCNARDSVVVRPGLPAESRAVFQRLHSRVTQFLDSAARVDRINNIISELDAARRAGGPVNANAAAEARAKVALVIQGCARFSTDLCAKFSRDYPDIVRPLCAAAGWTTHGMQLALVAAGGGADAPSLRLVTPVSKAIRCLMSIPASESDDSFDGIGIQALETLCAPDILNALRSLFARARDARPRRKRDGSKNRGKDPSRGVTMRILHAALLRAEVLAMDSGSRKNPRVLRLLGALFGRFVQAWRRAREERRRREREKQELFKFKEQTFEGNTKDGKEKTEAELKRLYPDFSETFSDLTGATSVEQVLGGEQKVADQTGVGDGSIADPSAEKLNEKKEEEDDDDDDDLTVGDALVPRVYAVYRRVFCTAQGVGESGLGLGLGTGSKGNGISNATMPISTDQRRSNAFAECYNIGVDILNAAETLGLASQLPSSLESITASAHQFMAARLHVRLSESSSSGEFDVYGPGAGEACRLANPLGGFARRLRELFQEFKSHPQLTMLAKLCERVGALPADAPVMQALTGVELILKKSEEWQSYVPRRFSLESALAPLSSIAMEWRRMELNAWPQTLRRVEQGFEDKAALAWCHLYELTHVSKADLGSFLSEAEKIKKKAKESKDKKSAVEASSAAAKSSSDTDRYLLEMYSAVTEFMEICNWGELPARSRVLEALRQETLSGLSQRGNGKSDECLPPEVRAQVANILGNVRKLHEPLCAAVAARVVDGRAPLEKKLKDAVKLARWDMSNYWSLRASTRASHRKLVALAQGYTELLSGPVRVVIMALEQADAKPGDRSVNFGIVDTRHHAKAISRERKEREERIRKEEEEFENKKARDANKSDTSAAAAPTETNKNSAEPDRPLNRSQRRARRRERLKAAKEARERDALYASHAPGFPEGGLSPPVAGQTSENKNSAVGSVGARMATLALRGVFGDGYSEARGEAVGALVQLSETVIRRSLALSQDEAATIRYKKKGLVDLLKALRGVGLSHRLEDARRCGGEAAGDIARSARASPLDTAVANLFLAPTQRDPVGCPGFEAGAVAGCGYSERYYYRSAVLLGRLRMRRPGCHHDISPSEATRALGFANHLFSMVTEQRRILSRLARGRRALELWLAATERVASSANPPSDGAEKDETAVDVDAKASPISNHAWALKRYMDEVLSAAQAHSMVVRAVAAVPLPGDATSDKAATSAPRTAAVLARLSALQASANSIISETQPRDPALPFAPEAAAAGARSGLARDMNSAWSSLIETIKSREWVAFSLKSPGMEAVSNAVVRAASRHHVVATGSAVRAASADPEASNAIDNLITEFKLSAQSVFKLASAWTDSDNSEQGAAKQDDRPLLIAEHRHVRSLSRALRLPSLSRRLERAFTAAANGNVPLVDLNACGSLVRQEIILLEKVTELVMGLQRPCSKLLYILLRVSNALFCRGFCRPPAVEDGDSGDEEAGEGAEGTGMGEGDTRGAKDVSNEIEDEEQLVGTQGDVPNDEGDEGAEDRKDDEGLEMEQEFEGQMHDVPEDEKDDEDREGSDDEGSEEEELDREMGDLDDDDKNVVDEKLWDPSDDEDDDGGQNDKTERGSDVKTGGETETQAKEDGDGGDDDDNKNAPEDPPGDDSDDNVPPPPKDADKDGEEEGAEEEEVVNDAEDQYADNTGVDPTEFPDEIKLDDGSDGDDDDAGSQADSIVGEDAEEGEGGSDDEGPGQDEEEMEVPTGLDEKDAEMDAEKDPEEKGPDDGGDDDSASQSADEKDAEKNTADMDASDSENDDAERDRAGEDGVAQVDEKEEENKEEETPQGKEDVMGEAGDAGMGLDDDDDAGAGGDDDNTRQKDPSAAETSSTQPKQPPSAQDMEEAAGDGAADAQDAALIDDDDAGNGDWRPAGPSDAQSAAQQDSAKQQQKQIEQLIAEKNPYRSLGDALKRFHERLNVVGEDKNAEKDAEMDGADDEGPNDADEKALPPSGAYQHVSEEQSADAQVAAGADEEDAARQQREEDSKNDDGTIEEERPDAMEVDAVPNAPDQDGAPGDGSGSEDDGDDGDEKVSDAKEKSGSARGGRRRLQRRRPPAAGEADQGDDAEEDAEKDKDERETYSALADDEAASDDDANAGSKMVVDVSDPTASLTGAAGSDPMAVEEFDENGADTARALAMAEPVEAKYVQEWSNLCVATAGLSRRLCEQLRAILEPTMATRLRGDYRTGKRINIKKIIPYIASQFRKDKIWMRRTKPSERTYQIMLVVDDSASMRKLQASRLALEAISSMTGALSLLEVGEVSVVSFGDQPKVIHPFDMPLTGSAGARVLSSLTFRQESNQWSRMLQHVIGQFERAQERRASRARGRPGQCLQIAFIVTDGFFFADRSVVRKWCREAFRRRQLLVLLILDSKDNPIDSRGQVSFENGAPKITKYLDDYPFPFYVILRDMTRLPEAVGNTLKEWFALIQQAAQD